MNVFYSAFKCTKTNFDGSEQVRLIAISGRWSLQLNKTIYLTI